MAKIIDAKKLNTVIDELIKSKEIKTDKKVIIIAATNDEAAKRYGNTKSRALAKININSEVVTFPENITQEQLQRYIIKEVNNNDDVFGCIIQLPLYKHLDPDIIVNTVHPFKDIDCLTYYRQGSLYTVNNKQKPITTCTAQGVELIISEHIGRNLAGKNVVIVGRGPLVADPLAKSLELKNATVTKVHTKTDALTMIGHLCKADIIISCAGNDMTHYINPQIVKDDAFIIGVGFRYIDGKQIQDFNVQEFIDDENFIGKVTSNTNATGLATIASFKLNAITLLENQCLRKGEK